MSQAIRNVKYVGKEQVESEFGTAWSVDDSRGYMFQPHGYTTTYYCTEDELEFI